MKQKLDSSEYGDMDVTFSGSDEQQDEQLYPIEDSLDQPKASQVLSAKCSNSSRVIKEGTPKPEFKNSKRRTLSVSDLKSKFDTQVLFRSNNKKSVNSSESHDIHSLRTLSEFIEIKKKAGEEPDFRVVVDRDMNLWFAKESHTGTPSPPHFGLVATKSKEAFCLTAGNLFLSEDYSTLKAISNKSGDFTPAFDSLKWLLAILVYNEARLPFKLPDFLTVIHQVDTSYVGEYKWPMVEIRDWLAKSWLNNEVISLEQKEAIIRQSHDKKTVKLQGTPKSLAHVRIHEGELHTECNNTDAQASSSSAPETSKKRSLTTSFIIPTPTPKKRVPQSRDSLDNETGDVSERPIYSSATEQATSSLFSPLPPSSPSARAQTTSNEFSRFRMFAIAPQSLARRLAFESSETLNFNSEPSSDNESVTNENTPEKSGFTGGRLYFD